MDCLICPKISIGEICVFQLMVATCDNIFFFFHKISQSKDRLGQILVADLDSHKFKIRIGMDCFYCL